MSDAGSDAVEARPGEQEAVILSGNNPAGTYTLENGKSNKKQDPQTIINEFWKNFNSTTPGKPFSILPDNLYAKRAALNAPKGVIPGHKAVVSYDEAVDACKNKVARIVKECRRVNQKYTDVHFDIEIDLKLGDKSCLQNLRRTGREMNPGSVKRVADIFDSPQFWIDGASSDDVCQGRDGDCWFIAALCTLSNVKGLIEKVCVARDEQVGVYGFVFHRDGEWTSTIVDDKLFLIKPDYDEGPLMERSMFDDRIRSDAEAEYRKQFQTGSGALYFAQCSDPNETWLPLLEKAYAKAHGDYSVIEGGYCGEALEDLTGGVTNDLLTTDILDKEKFWKEELMEVNKQFLFGCDTGPFGGLGMQKGIVENHAYSIMKAVEIDGERLVLLKNPWGQYEWNGPWSDGSKEWTPEWMQKLNHRFGDDGAFWISYKDLLRKYRHFERTRLFDSDWTVTQKWVSVQVPWAIDYLSTKFKITVEKSGPVVISLSQLDTRYFQGLEGEYYFDMQFRLHKDDERDYIVRSRPNMFATRSCSTELDLEAGSYSVVFKISANKFTGTPPPEQVIREISRRYREKLLQVGLSYDMAHAKGRVVETPEEIKAKEERKEKKRKNKIEAERAKVRAKRTEFMEQKLTTWNASALYQSWMSHNQSLAEKRAAAILGLPDTPPGPPPESRAPPSEVGEERSRGSAEEQTGGDPEKAENAEKGEGTDTKEKESKDEATTTEEPKAVVEETEKVSAAEPEATPAEAAEETKTAEVEEASGAEEVKKEVESTEADPSPKKEEEEKEKSEEIPEATKETPLAESTGTDASSTFATPGTSTEGAEAPPEAPEAPEAPEVPKAGAGEGEGEDGQPRPPPQPPAMPAEIDWTHPTFDAIFPDFEDEAAEKAKAEKESEDTTAAEDDTVEDEFTKDPWNAVCVCGLRVYSRNGGVTVEVVLPPEDEDEDEEDEKGEEEKKLDEDDAGKDAVKGTEGAEVGKETAAEDKKDEPVEVTTSLDGEAEKVET